MPDQNKPEKVGVPALGNRGQGRKKGVPNKVTQSFRETIQKLLDSNKDNIAKWVKQVAEGAPAVYDANGKLVFPARAPDPAAAAGKLAHLAEFAAPRLSRQETVGDGGGPLTVVIRKESES
jgi:hypothetical protein